jgi:hypothetical protein
MQPTMKGGLGFVKAVVDVRGYRGVGCDWGSENGIVDARGTIL